MSMRLFWLVSLSLIAFAAAADNPLWEKLQKDSDMVVLMRNSESAGNRDGSDMLVWDSSGNCVGESMLTVKGKAHAKAIGEAFAKRGIAPKVISSPMCRCRETSQIAFGEYLTDQDLRQRATGDADGNEVFEKKVNELLGKHRGKTPVVLVNHRPNIDALTMEFIDIGDLVVGTITQAGDIQVLGKIRIAP